MKAVQGATRAALVLETREALTAQGCLGNRLRGRALGPQIFLGLSCGDWSLHMTIDRGWSHFGTLDKDRGLLGTLDEDGGSLWTRDGSWRLRRGHLG